MFGIVIIIIIIIIILIIIIIKETKCEVIARDHLQHTGSLKGFSVVSSENTNLLGAPLGPGDALDNALEVKCSDMRTAISRLKSIAAHDALILLRSSLSAPRLIHIMICALCINHPFLLTHDSPLRKGISVITNCCLSDIHWFQASLPILRQLSWYTTRVFAGTFRLLGFSREHARLTGSYATRLLRRSGHRGSVGSGHLELIQRSSLPKRHTFSSSTIMGRTQRDM